MDLRTFVSETLTQISKGIADAQAANPDVRICPPVNTSATGGQQSIQGDGKAVQEIIFDIAVTAAENDSTKGEGGIKVFYMSFGASGEHATQNATVSRIKFSLPVLWPVAGGIPRHGQRPTIAQNEYPMISDG